MGSSPPRRVVLGAIAVLGIVGAGLVVSPSVAVARLESAASDPLTFGLLVAALYLVRPALAWPTTPLAAVVGYGFGVSAGIPIATAGVLVTILPPFVVIRRVTSRPDKRERNATSAFGTTLDRARRYVDRYYDAVGATRGVVVSRLAPIPSDVATACAAIRGVSTPQLLVGTAIGELPWTVAAVTVGASTASLTGVDGQQFDPLLLASCLLAAGLVIAGPLYRTVADRDRSGSGA
ncbi:hypothetical protein Halru_2110 [Halovivax ruber XH-70]|uniref:VTT domain-containing protein n=1 Tax=Halovivax ruber (strain DSM 18193 / JCM 13892 / XH-70) TaxID=797302 RepID=L0IEP8_HALRX|nr:VTT domain-containing protein [Halovivax ruber]AGB16701.1 hypothetical protein Halru_2110 [Halovivax ruber XH-70]